MVKISNNNSGFFALLCAYFWWGVLPIYWKLLGDVPATQIIAHRIIWSFVFMVILVLAAGMTKSVWCDWQELKKKPKHVFIVVLASILITFNWLAYVWAVNDNRILETSLGYYINPLLNILLGVIVLREKLTFWQVVAIILAALGVGNMIYHFGSIPWVSFVLAITMGFYSLCKKTVKLNAITSMTIETMLITPFAFIYLFYVYFYHQGYPITCSLSTVLLVGCGIITAVPLLLFAHSANKLSMVVIGITQYVSPTLTFLIGVFVYNEAFTSVHLTSFTLIWFALALFSISNIRQIRQKTASNKI